MSALSEFANSVGPDVVYLLLMMGLWLGITAIYTPGTGIPEILALVTGGIGFAGLFLLPTNLLAFALIVIAMACFVVVIFKPRAWYLIIIAGVLQLVGSIFLFKVGSRPSLISILLINAAALAYHQLILRPGLKIQERPRMLDDETLVGQIGEVVTPLDPVGTVRVMGELWRARADYVMEAGQPVRVTKRQGLEIHVARTTDSASESQEATPQAT